MISFAAVWTISRLPSFL